MNASTEGTKILHTPGPWSADPKRLMIETAHGKVEGPVMSYLAGNKGTAPGMTVSVASERHADHYLCAAAPDLLAAAKRTVALWDAVPMSSDARSVPLDLNGLRNAIAKAERK